MNKLKALYASMDYKSSSLKSSERALVLFIAIFVVPAIYFYLIYPAGQISLKKAAAVFNNARIQYERLSREEATAKERLAEIKNGQEQINYINSLVSSPDSAIQLINTLNGILTKNEIEIKFIKNNAQFDRIYEKHYMPPEGSNGGEKFSFKLLPVEFVFKSTGVDFMCFLNIMEGFKGLNFNTKKITASRSNDGKIEAYALIEIIVELNFNQNNPNG